MTYSLVELDEYSGKKTTVYSLLDEKKETLFDKFIKENEKNHLKEVQNIAIRIKEMSKKTGIRDNFIKTKEGNPGDGICALYDDPNSNLRLYFIKYGSGLIVLGSGGQKSKEIKAFQEDDKLTKENYLLRNIVTEITKKMKDKDIWIAEDQDGEYFNSHNDDDLIIQV